MPAEEIRWLEAECLDMPEKLSSAVHIINANTARIFPIPLDCNARRQQVLAIAVPVSGRGGGEGGVGVLALRHSKRSAVCCN